MNLMKGSTLLLAGIALVVSVMLMVGALRGPVSYHGTHITPPIPAADFTLHAADGPVSLADLHGRVAVLFFGYTSCPDVCPATLLRVSEALETLPERQREDVRVVFVSVDPERDSPERASSYARAVNPSFLGLSGSRDEVDDVTGAFGIYNSRVDTAPGADADHGSQEPAAAGAHAGHDGYLVDHTSTITVLNREGGIELYWSSTVTAQQMAEDLTALLRR